MLTTLISMICALNMSVGTPAVDTMNVYVIDKVMIENFDGSQLKGKTVLDYSITLCNGVRTHNITTQQGSEQSSSTDSKPKMIYVVNSKVVPEKVLNGIKPDNIKEMRVIKNPDSPEARKYNYGSGASVIIVTTK